MATPAAVNVANAYANRVGAVRATVVRSVEARWRKLDSWHTADIKGFAKSVRPIIEGGQMQVASLTDAYLAQFEASATGKSVRPVGIKPASMTTLAIRGVPALDVYFRLGPTVWWGLSKGMALDAAVEKARARLVSMVSVDLQLAKTHTCRMVLAAKGNVSGFKRVTRGTCDLCLSTAHQQYAVDELMPIHPGCNCMVEPIYDDRAPVHINTPEKPEEPVTVAVKRHGELGPLLVVAGYAFSRHKSPDKVIPSGAERFEDEADDEDE